MCVQHEMDHLLGKVFVEYLSPLKRDRIRTKMLKKQREEQRAAEPTARCASPSPARRNSPRIALAAIVAAGHDVPLVLTQPDRPAGRGMTLQPSAVKQFARRPRPAAGAAAQPAARRPVTPTTPQQAQRGAERRGARRDGRRRLRADPAAVGAGAAAPRLPEHPCLAAAALARRRADPARDRSRRRPHRHHDHADGRRARHRRRCCSTSALAIAADDTAGTLHDRLAALGARLVVGALDRLRSGTAAAAPAARRRRDLRQQDRQVRSGDRLATAGGADRTPAARLRPVPGLQHRDSAASRSRSGAAASSPGRGEPGALLDAADGRLVVACGDGALQLLELQLPGGRRIAAADFLRRHPGVAR